MKYFCELERVYKDSDFDVRLSPQKEVYWMNFSIINKFRRISFEDAEKIALKDRDSARNLLNKLFPNSFADGKFLGTDLTYDSIIAVIKDVCQKGEKEYLKSRLESIRSQLTIYLERCSADSCPFFR